jgi:hypothetical protein
MLQLIDKQGPLWSCRVGTQGLIIRENVNMALTAQQLATAARRKIGFSVHYRM